ncbi:chromo' (CHRromatin Organization MOdifier) domain protein [Ostertagia ostertagi]
MSFETDELMPASHKDMHTKLSHQAIPSQTEILTRMNFHQSQLMVIMIQQKQTLVNLQSLVTKNLLLVRACPRRFYEVEKILDHDETKEGLFYLVHWKGFSEEDDSWEPAENLVFATKAIAEYESTKKSKSKKNYGDTAVTLMSKKRSRQKASVEKSESEPEPEIPSDDIEDEDYNEKPKNSKKASAPPKGSGTITKAALKSYSPTTPRNRRGSTSTSTYVSPSETLSAAKKDFEVKPDPMQALLMRQSWLYDSDSDEDSGTEKENEKKMEQRKQIEEEQSRLRREEEQQKQKEESRKVIEEPPRSSERKRKAEDSSDKKKRHRNDVSEKPVEVASPTSESYHNGEKRPSVPPAISNAHSSSAPSTSITEHNPQEEVQIFAIGKVNDGRIRVVIGNDQAKKVVSLRDAHDANSWGLLQHLLQYAIFDDFDE